MKIHRKSVLHLVRISLALLCGVVVLQWPASVHSQFPPEKLENLQVFPKDIDSKHLIDVMKKFSQSLGVRCWFCHKGEEGQDLSTFDFVTDENPHKVIAREMLRMTGKINGELVPAAMKASRHGEEEEEGGHKVTCLTCHRGNKKPEN